MQHMGHPTAYTNTTPAGYKEDIAWQEIPAGYTEEEKAKIRAENYEKGGEMATKSVHDLEVTDHPVPKPGPPQFKNEIKKCTTKGCELDEDQLREKLEDKEKEERKKELKERDKKDKEDKEKKEKEKKEKLEAAAAMQVSEPNGAPVMFFNTANQDKLFNYINSPSINSLAFRGHKDTNKNVGNNPIYPSKDSASEILPYNQRDHAWNEEQYTNSSEPSWQASTPHGMPLADTYGFWTQHPIYPAKDS